MLADLTPDQARIASEALTTQVVLATVETPLAATALSYLVERALNATLTSAAGEPIPTQSFYDLLNILADDYLLTNERISRDNSRRNEEEDNKETPALPITE